MIMILLNLNFNISQSNHLTSIYGGYKLCTGELGDDEKFKILSLPNYENSYKYQIMEKYLH